MIFERVWKAGPGDPAPAPVLPAVADALRTLPRLLFHLGHASKSTRTGRGLLAWITQKTKEKKMADKVIFKSSYTTTTSASPADIWALWTNVKDWPSWDYGTERADIRGDFAAGSVISMTPRNGSPIQVQLKKVITNKEFSDEAVLPSGVVRTVHRIDQHGKHVAVTYEVVAEISEDAAARFQAEMWPHLQGGVLNVVHDALSKVHAG
jgi:hypothetical protein